MRKYLIQLNKESGDSGDVPTFDKVDNLSQVINGEAPKVNENDSEDPTDEEEEEDLSADSADGSADSADKEEDEEPTKESKSEKPKLVVADEETDDEESDEHDENVKKATAAATDEEEADEDEINTETWIGVGKAIGVDIPNDDFTEFHTAVKAKITKLETDLREAHTNPIKALDDNTLAITFGPEGAFAVKYLMSGGTIDSLINPVSGKEKELYDSSNEDLVLEDLKKEGYSDAGAKKELEFLKETERFETKAEAIRARIEKEHIEIIQKNMQNVIDGIGNQKENLINLSQREDSELVELIQKRNEYLGLELDKEAKDKIVQKIKTGFYRERLKNVKNMEEMILAYEFSKAAVAKKEKSVAEKVSSSKTKEFIEKVHNVPVGAGSGRSKKSSSSTNPDMDGFRKFNAAEPVTIV